ncbi:AAA family ATPase [Methylocaldum gracile]
MRNWRSYRNATFLFPNPNSHQNIILVGAQNGTGKTSLLMALYLGLFGREAMNLIEGIRLRSADDEKSLTYKTLMEQIIHRPALRLDEPHCSVAIRFESSNGDSILVQRRWNFSRGGKIRDLSSPDGEEVLAEIYGKRKVYRTWQDANVELGELIFPVNVMGCFFFDGEQAQERVEAAGGSALLHAVNTLYGTGILDKLSESLLTFINNSRDQLRRETGSVKIDELDQKREELDQAKELLKEIENELTAKQKERESVDLEHQSLLSDLQQLVGDSAADIEEYARVRGALESESLEIKQELIRGLSAIALPLAMTRYVEKVRSILRAEQIRDRWLLLKEEASGKAARIIDSVLPEKGVISVEPPLEQGQINQLRTKLEKALEALWSPPPDGCAEAYTFHFLKDADRAAVLSKLSRYQVVGGTGLVEAAIRLDNVTTRLREVQRKHDRVKEIEPRLASLKKEVTNTLDHLRQIGDQITGLEHREKGLQEHIKNLKAAIGQMEKRRAVERPVLEKLDIAHRVRITVDEAKEALIPLCKESLEQRCTEHFRNMISDEYQNFVVRFDSESQPKLEGPGGSVIFVSSLSGAQKRAFGLAFTLAVADVSGQQAPIVIDTPVGNMDSQYRERVLRYVAQAAPGQVIFLSHDEEISPFYRQRLEQKILKTFLVNFEKAEEGSGVSTLIENTYF